MAGISGKRSRKSDQQSEVGLKQAREAIRPNFNYLGEIQGDAKAGARALLDIIDAAEQS